MNRKIVRPLIITGLSGSGKSTAVRVFEDMGYFCTDNIPPRLIPGFLEIYAGGGLEQKIALVADIRSSEELFRELVSVLDGISRDGYEYDILFIDASDETIVARYKETRRNHPLAARDSLTDGIRRERNLLAEIKGRADVVLDTSDLSPKGIADEIYRLWDVKREDVFLVNIVSFGFKYGIPKDVDLLLDVRFLPNPFYIPEMKMLPGTDPLVRDYVLGNDLTRIFLEKQEDLLTFLLPYYIAEGKTRLSLAFGCTGGQHRSVVLAEEIGRLLKGEGYDVTIRHRDVDKKSKKAGNNGGK